MITITPEAVEHIRELVPAEERDKKGLRLSIHSGGCSGMQYEMKIDEKKPEDEVVRAEDVNVFIDRASTVYLHGSQLTFKWSLTDIGFRIINPQAKSTCGCGTSFET